MTGKVVDITSEPANNRPRRTSKRADVTGLTHGLERLRQALLQRLDELEALAIEQTEMEELPPSDRERVLRERVGTLEASLARVQAELIRRDEEWAETSREIEADRQLLAEAWQRLEDERARGKVSAATARAEPAPRSDEGAPVYREAQPDESNDPITKSILRQFQALQGDVRRNAKGRGTR
jgi:chromosome segregation ATPase